MLHTWGANPILITNNYQGFRGYLDKVLGIVKVLFIRGVQVV